MTLEDFKNFAINAVGLGSETVKNYIYCIERFILFLSRRGKTPIDATVHDIIDFFEILHRTKAKSTEIVYQSAIRLFYDYLVYTNKIDRNIAREFRRKIKVEYRLPMIITLDEARSIIDNLKDEKMKFLFGLQLCTGARISEVLTLEGNDIINFERVRYFGKGGRERIVPIIYKFYPLLEELIRKYFNEGRLFNYSRIYVTKKLKVAMRKVIKKPIKYKATHVFRSVFATEVYRMTNDLLLTQRLLGHVKLDTTSRYAQVAMEDVERRLREVGLI